LDEFKFAPIFSFVAAHRWHLSIPTATMTGWKRKRPQQAPEPKKDQLALIEEGPTRSPSAASPPQRLDDEQL
jgi:hypothetical protein